MSVPYHPTLHVTAALARRVERAEIDFCAEAGEVGTRAGIASLEVGGGRALFGVMGSPLNKMLGLGVRAPVTDGDLDAIEAFYAAHGSPAQIELCPLAAADVAPRLSARGFMLQGFENELARPLAVNGAAPAIDSVLRVGRASSPEQDDLWIDIVSEGFAAAEISGPVTPESIDRMKVVMRQFNHPAIARYLVWAHGEPAGGGATYVRDGVLGVFGTATLPRYRRRGVQTALVSHVLAEETSRADLAIATTEPGSTSQRTFERLGFSLIYTRAILVKRVFRTA
jgi:GNAT superfamily N-acetyltransferase